MDFFLPNDKFLFLHTDRMIMAHQPWDIRLNHHLWHQLAITCKHDMSLVVVLQKAETLANRYIKIGTCHEKCITDVSGNTLTRSTQ